MGGCCCRQDSADEYREGGAGEALLREPDVEVVSPPRGFIRLGPPDIITAAEVVSSFFDFDRSIECHLTVASSGVQIS